MRVVLEVEGYDLAFCLLYYYGGCFFGLVGFTKAMVDRDSLFSFVVGVETSLSLCCIFGASGPGSRDRKHFISPHFRTCLCAG